MNIVLLTGYKSLHDHSKKDGAVPEDKWVAVAVASVKGMLSAGAGRDTRRAECRWIASRLQLADCLTKTGLSNTLRLVFGACVTRLRELSKQQMKCTEKPKLFILFNGM